MSSDASVVGNQAQGIAMSIEHISKRWSAAIVAAAGLLVSGATTTADLAQQPASESPRVTVGDDGTVQVRIK